MRKFAAVAVISSALVAAISSPRALSDGSQAAEPATTEALCAQQGEIMANAARMRDAGAPRFEALATARRELEHSQLDQAGFKSHLADDVAGLYAPNSPYSGSSAEVGQLWKKNCLAPDQAPKR